MEPIAIVGLGCLFPGADNPMAYWENLCRQKDSASPVSEQELGTSPDNYYHPVPGTADKINYNRNGYVRDFIFNSQGYYLSPDELNSLDALFKWTLYAAEQALSHSGYRHNEALLKKTGLIIGNIGMPTHAVKRLMTPFYHQLLQPYIQTLLHRPDFRFDAIWPPAAYDDANLITGGHSATVAALALGLAGPSFALDAACSSALYAIKLASDYLESGKADLMLAGAVCHADHIYINHGFNVLQAFPKQGISIPFDRASEGLKAGEGAGIVALKRYRDAVRDNDTVYAVIESVGLSNDAGAKHMLVPDIQGQRTALARAYPDGDTRIDYLECHATGTPVGDQVELASVEGFFAAHGALPLIGANKANNGHMLTASGMGSLLKVVLSLNHGQIPATPGVTELVNTPEGKLTLDHVVRSTRAWPDTGRPKRAGINAFGFGGVNAHLVVSEDHAGLRARHAASSPTAQVQQPLALVGIGVHLAHTQQSEQLAQVLKQGEQFFTDLPRTRWIGMEQRPDVLAQRGVSQPPQGAYIERFDFDCKHFKLPPNVVGPHLLSHLFLLPVAERAFLDAGYALDGSRRNIAVIVAGGVDYGCLRYQARNEIGWQLAQSLQRCGISLSGDDQAALESIVRDGLFPAPYPEGITGGIGNIVASRLAAHLRLNGPTFSLYSEESAPFKAIELAQFMLARQQVDAVLIASCSFAGGVENVLWDHQSLQANQDVGDGGGVVVLKREQDALRDDTAIYALVDGLAIAHAPNRSLPFKPAVQTLAENMTAALAAAGCDAHQVAYVEAYAGARPGELEAECAALHQAYRTEDRATPLTLGTLKAHYGHLSAASGLLGIIKTALQLSQRYLPGVPDFTLAEPLRAAASGPGLQVPRQGADWPTSAQGPRRAAISHIGVDRAYSHLILREPTQGRRASAGHIASPASVSLNVSVFTGRDKTVEEIVLSEAAIARFAALADNAPVTRLPPVALSVTSRVPHDTAHQWRHAYTQLRYLTLENTFHRLIARQLGVELEPSAPVRPRPVLDYQQLLELTDGSIARVLGEAYQEADSYPIRTRMPSPPYLFVSRITALSAQKDRLEPGFIEWEYDIPPDAWYVVDGKAPAFMSLESSHAMIVAFTVIGCDMMFKGQLCYRAVDSQTTVYSEMPVAGETLRGRVNITSVVKAGGVVLIGYEYFCYVDDRLVFKLVANSGFFSARDMARAKHLDTAAYFRETIPSTRFTPPLRCDKTALSDREVSALLQGDVAACFGAAYARPGIGHICNPHTRMLDRVVSMSRDGGAFGLGEMLGEVDIDPDHFVFKAHFKNDPVMPGTFLVEGCEQMVKVFLHYLGLNSQPHLTPRTLCDHHYSARFRGEVKCERDVLRYRLTCKSVNARYAADGHTLEDIALTFIVEMLYRGNVIGLCDNLGAGFSRDASDAAATHPHTTPLQVDAAEPISQGS
ncbi:beta-ketoacyl synthase N-terminal-like domain-containing protein [Dickeya fangzhongdai]|uniref:hotdog fold thioesterase n=1 Tax=Dickeya fangzhongdai TaxID=1778540 RepID=UPI0004F7BEC1|nr:beta-ketoacyl synthase N-terminal-like domain-containing protein [Dickeya fangzhongdai]AIR68611.1 beta-ketoacyl synthase [Dickeya fangzhongdai]KGT99361.1 beta-ketoacyl synthase [Dickeya fangzhongdai]